MADSERVAMPEQLRELAEQAIKRHKKRPIAPEVVSLPEHREWQNLTCPYRDEDESLWLALLLECFGTRTAMTAQAFMRQLADLCPEVWHEGENRPRRCEEALRQALSIVYGLKPRNEAEAAAAAQYVALHFASMKLGASIGKHSYVDPRTIASLAAVSKASAAQLTAIQRGRSRNISRQTIKVEKHVHIHNDRHLHLHGEGERDSGGQSQAKGQQRAHARAAGSVVEVPALRSENEGGNVLPLPCRPGPEAVPNAWERGSAEGGEERELEARRLDRGSDRPAPGSRSAA
jgi:hypothetical protein